MITSTLGLEVRITLNSFCPTIRSETLNEGAAEETLPPRDGAGQLAILCVTPKQLLFFEAAVDTWRTSMKQPAGNSDAPANSPIFYTRITNRIRICDWGGE
jgi:hypothetical protein